MKKIFIYIATSILLVITLCVLIFVIRPDNSSNKVLEVKGYEHIIQCSDTPYCRWQE